mmetsp:Transcript_1673/g.5443  ORF Transcript_1673/g.5443 Transcript_1673/m.5443 type:complete len:472 (+) Transcript_1673:1240-2655(+)
MWRRGTTATASCSPPTAPPCWLTRSRAGCPRSRRSCLATLRWIASSGPAAAAGRRGARQTAAPQQRAWSGPTGGGGPPRSRPVRHRPALAGSRHRPRRPPLRCPVSPDLAGYDAPSAALAGSFAADAARRRRTRQADLLLSTGARLLRLHPHPHPPGPPASAPSRLRPQPPPHPSRPRPRPPPLRQFRRGGPRPSLWQRARWQRRTPLRHLPCLSRSGGTSSQSHPRRWRPGRPLPPPRATTYASGLPSSPAPSPRTGRCRRAWRWATLAISRDWIRGTSAPGRAGRVGARMCRRQGPEQAQVWRREPLRHRPTGPATPRRRHLAPRPPLALAAGSRTPGLIFTLARPKISVPPSTVRCRPTGSSGPGCSRGAWMTRCTRALPLPARLPPRCMRHPTGSRGRPLAIIRLRKSDRRRAGGMMRFGCGRSRRTERTRPSAEAIPRRSCWRGTVTRCSPRQCPRRSSMAHRPAP